MGGDPARAASSRCVAAIRAAQGRVQAGRSLPIEAPDRHDLAAAAGTAGLKTGYGPEQLALGVRLGQECIRPAPGETVPILPVEGSRDHQRGAMVPTGQSAPEVCSLPVDIHQDQGRPMMIQNLGPGSRAACSIYRRKSKSSERLLRKETEQMIVVEHQHFHVREQIHRLCPSMLRSLPDARRHETDVSGSIQN